MPSIHDQGHPLWSLLRFATIMICVTVVMAVNANSFDEDEYIKITQIALAVGGYEGITSFLSKTRKTNGKEKS